MRANDPVWLRLKLETLAKTASDRRLRYALPPHGELKKMPSVCSAVAQLVRLAVRAVERAARRKSTGR